MSHPLTTANHSLALQRNSELNLQSDYNQMGSGRKNHGQKENNRKNHGRTNNGRTHSSWAAENQERAKAYL